jgi:hypothetical protein
MINSVAWSYDDSRIATADDNEVVQIWFNIHNPFYNKPPQVSIDSPQDGDTVSNTIVVNGTAIDDHEVITVIYKIDGTNWIIANGKDNWTFVWDTRYTPNGWLKISVRAFDGERFSHLAVVNVNVLNDETTLQAPNVTIDEPSDGSLVSEDVLFVGRAWGANQVEMVRLSFLDKEQDIVLQVTTWRLEVDTRSLPNGTIEFVAAAFDGLLWSEGASVNLTVHNNVSMPNRRPFVVIYEPVEDQEVSFYLLARGSAADEERKLRFVLLKIDNGNWHLAESQENWPYVWNFTFDTWKLNNGPHRLSALCADDVQVSEIVEVTFIVNNDLDHPYGRPNFRVLSPENGSIVSGLVTLEGIADNEVLIENIRVIVKGEDPLLANGKTTWTFDLDTLQFPNGPLEVRMWASGIIMDSEVVELHLIIENDRPPTCVILWPVPNQTFLEDTEIMGTAFDPEGGELEVEVQIDVSDWLRCTGSEEWTFSWSIGDLPEGEHTIRARSFDGSNYSDVQEVEVRVVRPTELPDNTIPTGGTQWLSIFGIIVLAVIGGAAVSYYRFKGT